MTPFQAEVLAKLKGECRVYLVGGAVRDEILGVPIKDVDVVTSMPKEALIELLTSWGYVPHLIGAQHQTVSLFRDGARMDFLDLTGSIEDDALRRDFSINAIYKDLSSGELIDPQNGLQDMKFKTLKACGLANDRFREDPVRILRMVRFAVKYKLELDSDTWQSAVNNLPKLSEVASERTTEELGRILVLDDIENAVKMLDELGYWREYLPELARLKGLIQNKYHAKDAWDHTLHVVKNTPNALLIRLAALFHDLGKWETASKECKVWGQLKVSGQKTTVNEFSLTGKGLNRYNGQYVDVLGARLDHYPNIIQVKRIRKNYSQASGFEWVVDGKRHFLGHEKESGKLTRQILGRYRWSMFLDPPGKGSEKQLVWLVEQHMNGTLTFMQELRGEGTSFSIKNKAKQYAWDAGWDGREFNSQRVQNLLYLWEADFFGGKQREKGDAERFHRVKSEIFSAAEWLDQNWRNPDWGQFEPFALEKGLQGESFGRFKDHLRTSVLLKGLDLRDRGSLENEFEKFVQGKQL